MVTDKSRRRRATRAASGSETDTGGTDVREIEINRVAVRVVGRNSTLYGLPFARRRWSTAVPRRARWFFPGRTRRGTTEHTVERGGSTWCRSRTADLALAALALGGAGNIRIEKSTGGAYFPASGLHRLILRPPPTNAWTPFAPPLPPLGPLGDLGPAQDCPAVSAAVRTSAFAIRTAVLAVVLTVLHELSARQAACDRPAYFPHPVLPGSTRERGGLRNLFSL